MPQKFCHHLSGAGEILQPSLTSAVEILWPALTGVTEILRPSLTSAAEILLRSLTGAAEILPSLKAAKYEIQKPSTCRATLFRCKFLSMFPVFHLARSTCPATKTFVAG